MNPFPSSSGASPAPLAAPVPPVRRDPALSIPASQGIEALVAHLARIAARKLCESPRP